MWTDILVNQERTIEEREVFLGSLAFLFLLLTALALSFATSARLEQWSAFGDRWGHFLVLPVWIFGFWLTRRALRRINPERDPTLLPTAFLLAGWGLLVIWRLFPSFGFRQTGWFIVGITVLYAVLHGDRHLSWLRRYRYVWMTVGLMLMVFTLVFGTHPTGGEPRLWLGCCGVYLQPSEPLRLLLVAFLASFLNDKLRFTFPRKDGLQSFSTLLPLIIIWSLSVVLLIVQRDLGMGMLFLALLSLLLYLATGRWQIIVLASISGILAGTMGYFLFDVVSQRIMAWINPWPDPIGGSYQLVQSLIALGSGGVIGRGFGLGSPGFIPAVHTDFIFTAIIEEFGLLGGLAVIALFAVLVSRGLRVAFHSRDPFRALLSAGISISIGLQAVLIIGGNIRLLPLVGVTLPFVSYGGSSLVTSFILLGILLLLSGKTERNEIFTRPLTALHYGSLIAWGMLALTLGWWTVYRAPVLVNRTDNPRRVVEDLYTKRGSIVDETGEMLAESTGSPGSYQRFYPHPESTTVIGYYSHTYGLSGLESVMDGLLRGREGDNPMGIWWSELTSGHPPPGSDLRLTFDHRVQKAAADQLSGYQGGLVLLEAQSGDILAMVSSPSYDPNRFDQEWQDIATDPASPLLNRVTQGKYQPGAVLSPYLLAWSMQMGIAETDDLAPNLDTLIEVNGQSIACMVPLLHDSKADYTKALLYGCPAPFATLGLELGADSFNQMLEEFGLLERPQVRLPSSNASGPSNLASEGALVLAAVGQGDLTINPLQLARAFAGLISEPGLPALRVVDSYRSPGGDWNEIPPLGTGREVLDPNVRVRIIEAISDAEGQPFGQRAEALTGEAGGRLGWYQGGLFMHETSYVVVVVIEDQNSIVAERIGRNILDLMRSEDIP
ncbi:MAG: FtsW/RodA/SpoVE family cell cycle protein [Anaerolineales bacterium]